MSMQKLATLVMVLAILSVLFIIIIAVTLQKIVGVSVDLSILISAVASGLVVVPFCVWIWSRQQ